MEAERASREHLDLERLLADALRPDRAARGPRDAGREHPDGDHRAGRGRALELGRRAHRGRARGAARPAQLGPPGGRGRRRRRSPAARAGLVGRAAAGAAGACAATPPSARTLARAPPLAAGSRLRGGRLAAGAAGLGVAAPAASPVRPRIRCRKLSSVLTGTRPRIESPLPIDEAPDREHEVEQPDRQRVGAGRVAGRRASPSRPVARWTRLCQPLTARMPRRRRTSRPAPVRSSTL